MLPSGQPVTDPAGLNVELAVDWSDLWDPRVEAACRARVAVPRSPPVASGFRRLPLAEVPLEKRRLLRDRVAVAPSDPVGQMTGVVMRDSSEIRIEITIFLRT